MLMWSLVQSEEVPYLVPPKIKFLLDLIFGKTWDFCTHAYLLRFLRVERVL